MGLIASLCWSAYTNGYIDNVNELLMSDKMRRRLKNAQHINEPVFDKQVAVADVGETNQRAPAQANFEAPIIPQQAAVQQPVQAIVPQFQPAAAPIIPQQPVVQQVPVAPPIRQQQPIAPVAPAAPVH